MTLVAYYKLDVDTNDVHKNALNGTNNGVSFVAGKINDAGEFNGTTDWVDLGDPSAFKTNVGSVSCWVKTTDASGVVFSLGNDTSNNYYLMLMVNGGAVYWYGYNNGALSARGGAGSGINDGQWHHVVWTSNGSAWKGWIDGVDAGSITMDLGTNVGAWFSDFSGGDNFSLGRLERPSQYGDYAGLIDDLRVFDHQLTQAEIDALYNYGSLHVHYKMDGNSDDSSGNDFTTTAIGDAAYQGGKINDGGIITDTGNGLWRRALTTELDNLSAFTVAFWIKYKDTPVNYHDLAFSQGGTGSVRTFNMYIDGTPNIAWNFYDDRTLAWKSVFYAYNSSDLSDQEWHHMAGTWDGINLRLYIDGDLKATSASFAAFTPGQLPTSLDIADGEFDAEFDDFRIYSSALEATDLLQLMVYKDPPQPLAHWKFDDDYLDYSGNGRYCTNNGATLVAGQINNAAQITDSENDNINFNIFDWQIFTAFNTAGKATFAFWINADSYDLSNGNYMLSGHPRSILIGTFNGNLRVLLGSDGSTYDDDKAWSIGMTTTNWYHIVVTYEAGVEIGLYVNGVAQTPIAIANTTLWIPTTSLIGDYFDGSNRYHWDGKIDDVRLYDMILTQSMVDDLFAYDGRGTPTILYDVQKRNGTGLNFNISTTWGAFKKGLNATYDVNDTETWLRFLIHPYEAAAGSYRAAAQTNTDYYDFELQAIPDSTRGSEIVKRAYSEWHLTNNDYDYTLEDVSDVAWSVDDVVNHQIDVDVDLLELTSHTFVFIVQGTAADFVSADIPIHDSKPVLVQVMPEVDISAHSMDTLIAKLHANVLDKIEFQTVDNAGINTINFDIKHSHPNGSVSTEGVGAWVWYREAVFVSEDITWGADTIATGNLNIADELVPATVNYYLELFQYKGLNSGFDSNDDDAKNPRTNGLAYDRRIHVVVEFI